MGGLLGTIVILTVFFGIPKYIETSKRNAMCDEVNYRAMNGIETDYNKFIDVQTKLWNNEITKNQYYDMRASGYDRKEKK